MTFLLPISWALVLFGQMFDLTSYHLMTGVVPLYDSDAIEPFIQVTRINELVAEYMFVDSESEYRKFLGVDVATNLKTLVGEYSYAFSDQMKDHIDPTSEYLYLAQKITLKTVNKSVQSDAPLINGCELQNIHRKKTHYVKSIIHGYSIYQLSPIYPWHGGNTSAIRESFLQILGKSGTLDESFVDKLNFALEENDIVAFSLKRAFGVFPENFGSMHKAPRELLALKNRFLDIMESSEEGRGLYYEMEPISSISPGFPFTDINRDIVQQLYDVEKKYEDLNIAKSKFTEWKREIPWGNLTEQQEAELINFDQGLLDVRNDFEKAIRSLDISTEGGLDQFSEALNSYGNTTDTKKYRKKVQRFRQTFESRETQGMMKKELQMMDKIYF